MKSVVVIVVADQLVSASALTDQTPQFQQLLIKLLSSIADPDTPDVLAAAISAIDPAEHLSIRRNMKGVFQS